MPRAFVLSSGGTLGAAQVGMLQALHGAGVTPDLLVGASVGALNATILASHPGPDGLDALDELWRNVRLWHLAPFRPWTGMTGLLGLRDHLVSPKGVRKIVDAHTQARGLEDLHLPVHVLATDALTNEAVTLSTGDAVRAVLASAATPGVFPPVQIAGRLLCDGGVAESTPVGPAVALGATEVWVLSVGAVPTRRPRGAIKNTLAAAGMMLGQIERLAAQSWAWKVPVRVVPRAPSWAVSPVQLKDRGRVVDESREAAAAWLAAGAEPLPGERAAPERGSAGGEPGSDD